MSITPESPLWPIMLDAIFGDSPASILTARTRDFARTLDTFMLDYEYGDSVESVLDRPGVWDGEPDPGVVVAFSRIVDAHAFMGRRFADGEDAVILRWLGRVVLITRGGDRVEFTRISLDAEPDSDHGTVPLGRGREPLRFSFS